MSLYYTDKVKIQFKSQINRKETLLCYTNCMSPHFHCPELIHCVSSAWCMTEFHLAYHHNVDLKRRKRLVMLMMLDNPADLYDNNASRQDRNTDVADEYDTATLRQYLRQYTYINYLADDWLDKLLYALPRRGLLQHNEDRNNDDALLLQ